MKQIKFLSILLASLCLASACTSNDKDSSSNQGITKLPENSAYEDGTHGGTVSELDGYVVKDGKSDYSIVIPANASSMLKFASEELQSLVLEATGVELPILADTATNATATSKILSIGKTRAFEGTGITVKKSDLGNDGFQVVTVDDDVYMCGGGDYGSLFAVYEFLWYELGFKQYSFDTYSLTETRQMQLQNFALTEVPDFQYREGSAGYLSLSSTVNYRMRWHDAAQGQINGSPHHNSFQWVPKSNKEAHPKWFADNDAQLCYTAHGDEAELELMLNVALESFKVNYLQDPDIQWITFTQEDVHDWCTCSTCTDMKKKYGTDSAVLIPFMNRLSQKMEAYVTSLHADDPDFVYDIDLAFFAYNTTTNAPAVKNADGVYVPMDDTMVMDEHVAVYYAPIYMDYTQSIYSTTNKVYYENSLAWDSVANRVYLWLYSTNYRMYLVPYDTFNATQEMYQFYAEIGTTRMFNQNQHNRDQIGSTAWNLLKVYLHSELSWNVNADVALLTKNFFDAMYGKASETMQKFYYSFRAYSAQMLAEGKYVGTFNIYHEALRSDYWSYPILKQWMAYIDQALKDIEPLKISNPQKYDMYYKNIVAERVSISYMMMELYESKYTLEYGAWLLETFEADCALAEIGRVREGSTVADYLKNKK